MNRRCPAGLLREVLLTFGAILGVVCLAATAAGVLLDVTPLVFRSGSMAPAIDTGDLAIARSVDAREVSPGDVVSVTAASGVRVTHRVVSVAGSGDERRLVLKGDANEVPDEQVYVVASVDRVVLTVPTAGYVVEAATGPAGLFVVGLYVAVLIGVVLGRGRGGGGPGDAGSDTTGHHRAAVSSCTSRTMVRTALVGSIAAGVLICSPASAAPWVDDASVSGPSLSTHRLTPPASVTCSGGGLLSPLTYTWSNTDLRYQYVVTLEDSTGTVRQTDYVNNSGSLATSQSITYSFTLLNGFVGVPATVTVRVRPRLTLTPAWLSQASVTSTGKLVSVALVGLESSCT